MLRQRMGRTDDARDLFTGSLEIAREVGNRRNEGVALGFPGDLQRLQGRFDKARPFIEKSLALHRALGNRRFEAALLARLDELLSQTGQRTEARALFAEAEAHMREPDDKLELAMLCCFRGLLALVEGRKHEPIVPLEETDELATALALEPGLSTSMAVAGLRSAIGRTQCHFRLLGHPERRDYRAGRVRALGVGSDAGWGRHGRKLGAS